MNCFYKYDIIRRDEQPQINERKCCELTMREPAALLNAGAVIYKNGRPTYRVDSFVCQNGEGMTYSAREVGSGRSVILRMFRSGERTTEQRISREAILTEKALCAQYTKRSGTTPKVTEVFRTGDGSSCFAFEACPGVSLRTRLESGWQDEKSREIALNSHLEEILASLAKTADLLSLLHRCGRLLYLEISPDTILVSGRVTDKNLSVSLPDYAYALGMDEALPEGYRLFGGEFAAPELSALAEGGNAESGSLPDESTDTYAVAAILFYAITGTVFSDEVRRSGTWRKRIGDAFPENTYPAMGERGSLAEELIQFFDRGLSSNRKRRYHDAAEMAEELRAFQAALTAGGLLRGLRREELLPLLALERYPLYEYANRGNDLKLLCVGDGSFSMGMIRTAASCGQMIDRRLQVGIPTPYSGIRDELMETAPGLQIYSDLTPDTDKEHCYLSFDFAGSGQSEPDDLLSWCGDYRYIAVSLGSASENALVAAQIAAGIHSTELDRKQKYILLYDANEGGTAGDAATEPPAYPNIEVIPLDIRSPRLRNTYDALSRRAFRTHYLYERLNHSGVNRVNCMRTFVSDPYAQKSSAAAALHIRYKLRSLGVALKASREEIIRQYFERMEQQHGEMMELEHRRWIMQMTMDGYQFPGTCENGHFILNTAKVKQYAFAYRNTERGPVFNGSFKSKAELLHPCLVPSSTEAGFLPREKSLWDVRYHNCTEVDNSIHDELDKVSLKLHLLAGEMAGSGEVRGRINSILEYRLSKKVRSADPEDIELQNVFRHFQDWVSSTMRSRTLISQEQEFSTLREVCQERGIRIDEEMTELENELSIFREYAAYRDYKKQDEDILMHLPWVYFAQDDLTVIKLHSEVRVANITSVCMLEPERVVYFGCAEDAPLRDFFRRNGNNAEVEFCPCRHRDYTGIHAALKELAERYSGSVIFDVSGTDAAMTAAAVRIADADKRLGVVRYDPAGKKLESISGYPTAAAYNIGFCLSVDDAYGLYGAKQLASSGRSNVYELRRIQSSVWEFYQTYRERWHMICAFFAYFTRSSELRLNDADVYETNRTRLEKMYDGNLLRASGFLTVLERLRDIAFCTALDVMETDIGTLVRYEVPASTAKWFENLTNQLTRKQLTCKTKRLSNGHYQIDISSGSYVICNRMTSFADRRDGKNNQYNIEDMIPPLKTLEEMNLIYRLQTVKNMDGTYTLSFYHLHEELRNLLAVEGNALEAYVWEQAEHTGYFDDVKCNFFYQWQKESVTNELDVICSKGMSTIVISCKAARFEKSHLYEVRYLTDTFSVNSKCVIVYATNQSYEDGRISDSTRSLRERAAAMGIYLLDAEYLKDDRLGETLIRIMDGTLLPMDLLKQEI